MWLTLLDNYVVIVNFTSRHTRIISSPEAEVEGSAIAISTAIAITSIAIAICHGAAQNSFLQKQL